MRIAALISGALIALAVTGCEEKKPDIVDQLFQKKDGERMVLLKKGNTLFSERCDGCGAKTGLGRFAADKFLLVMEFQKTPPRTFYSIAGTIERPAPGMIELKPVSICATVSEKSYGLKEPFKYKVSSSGDKTGFIFEQVGGTERLEFKKVGMYVPTPFNTVFTQVSGGRFINGAELECHKP